MHRIQATFDRLRRERRKALMPFIMGGDPDLAATRELIRTLADAGADLIEVGIPFSDPLADGPTIQRAAARALARGTTPEALLAAIARVSAEVGVPIVALSYWNPILHYAGHGRGGDPSPFVRAAACGGIDGVVVPDLPVEEAGALRSAGRRHGVNTIVLAAPTSPPDRLRQIARHAEGFIYYVSLTGTTGVRRRLPTEWLHGVRQLKLLTTKPICVGFGISTPAQARAVASAADGVIVGSALIAAMEPHLRQRRRLLRAARAFVGRLRRAV